MQINMHSRCGFQPLGWFKHLCSDPPSLFPLFPTRDPDRRLLHAIHLGRAQNARRLDGHDERTDQRGYDPEVDVAQVEGMASELGA